MLNSMCQHIKTVIDGMAIPFQAQPLDAKVQPPTIQMASGPKAYIVGAASAAAWKRQSMPRGPGFQQFDWPIQIYLTLLMSTQVDNLEYMMPAFVDAVLWQLLTTEMPIFVTDNVTGRETELVLIAESGKVDSPPGRLTDDMRMLQYGSGLTINVKEIVQA
jgi:hypothetical protein